MESLLEKLSGFLESKVELAKLEIKKELADVLTKVVILFLLLYVASFAILFALLGVAKVLNEVMRTEYWGYFIIFGMGLIKFLVLGRLAQQEKFIKAVERMVQKMMGIKPEEEEAEAQEKAKAAKNLLEEPKKEDQHA